MQSTNTGILKPALWHTPAITNDGVILQAPDPREKRAGFTPSPHQAVEMRTSSAPTHLDLQGLSATCLSWVSGAALVSPVGAQVSSRGAEVQTLSHLPAV